MNDIVQALEAIIYIILKMNKIGLIELSRQDFVDVGFEAGNCSLPLLITSECKGMLNGYGFDYIRDTNNGNVQILRRIEDFSIKGGVHCVKMCSINQSEIYRVEENLDRIDSKGYIAKVLENRNKLILKFEKSGNININKRR